MEIKVLCDCGQKFKFDVEPVNGRMPFVVNCPSCGVDGTPNANAFIAQSVVVATPPVPPPIPVAAPAPGRLQINRAAPTAAAPVTAAPPPSAPPPPPRIAPAPRPAAEEPVEFSMLLGIVGALAGAGAGMGL